ncbi:MAG: mechanosensitive ion channel family protein [Campylobacteraceae bacterium]|nr:mechanosensitive ion channel family protein [Campylobacteraceae bacterium]
MEHFQTILDATLLSVRLQDIAIAIGIFSFFLFLRAIFSKTIIIALKTLTSRTKTTLDEKLVNALEDPSKFAFTILGFYLAKEWLKLETIDGFLDNIIGSAVVLIVFWTLYRLINEFKNIFTTFSSKFGQKMSSDIENFIIKTLRVIIIALGVMAILQEWGINVSAFVASLGLGGLAFALAAKDTAANLFGSLVLFTDRPFKIGDWVEVGSSEGVVEDIGIRSTKVRTFAQALITIPNATVANSAITNWTRMGKRRIKMSLRLTYNTSTAQMEEILKKIREYLTNNEAIHPETIMIYFDEFGESSLNLFCYFFTKTTAWANYLEVREKVNLELMRIIENSGTSLAFPTQTLHVESLPSNPSKVTKI